MTEPLDTIVKKLRARPRPFVDTGIVAHCPACGQQVDIWRKKGGTVNKWGYHSIDRSWAINPMAYQIRFETCRLAGKRFEDYGQFAVALAMAEIRA